MNTVAGPAGLPRVRCEKSGASYLLDTGAAISLVPPEAARAQKLDITPRSLLARTASGKTLPLHGSFVGTIKVSGRDWVHRFYVADVDERILGSDFIQRFGLVIYPEEPFIRPHLGDDAFFPGSSSTEESRVAATAAGYPKKGAAGTRPPGPCVLDAAGTKAMFSVNRIEADFREEFRDVFSSGFSGMQPLHGVEHRIETTAGPCAARARRLSPEKLQQVKHEFEAMERLGIVRRSSSPWASPLVCVQKPDGSVRPCGDYRLLNSVTKKDRYALPHLRDFQASLAGCTVFSTVDLTKAYYQVPVAEDSIAKTAVITPFGSWEFLVLPFGVCNAVPTFQRLVDTVLAGLPFVFAYLDDLLIFSRNPAVPQSSAEVSGGEAAGQLFVSPGGTRQGWSPV